MSSIANQSSGLSQRQNALSDAQFSSYVREQSVSAYESLDAGLTIRTKEGDLVTLTSNTYSEFNAFMYDSKGMVQTESGKAVVTQNIRSISLTSGESFAFSVVGELSEAELADIEAIVKGIDEIISEMVEGDMDDAVAKALSMGGYDTVSMYSADLSYKRSYAMASETHAESVTTLPKPEIQPEDESAVPSVTEPFPENHRPRKKKNNSIRNINQFVEKMAEKLEEHEDRLVDKAQKPIDRLFDRHKKNAEESQNEDGVIYDAIEAARLRLEELIDQMTGGMFKENLSEFLK